MQAAIALVHCRVRADDFDFGIDSVRAAQRLPDSRQSKPGTELMEPIGSRAIRTVEAVW